MAKNKDVKKTKNGGGKNVKGSTDTQNNNEARQGGGRNGQNGNDVTPTAEYQG